MEDNFLDGKGALITGGASGFGRGAAYALAEKGADLVLVDINESLLEETAKKVKKETGGKVVPIICDVSKSDQVKAMAKQTFEELDNVYILFNNAGIADYSLRDITKVKEVDWDRVMDVNLKGQWLVMNSLLKFMKKQQFEPLAGKIICTSSLGALQLPSILPTYSISKVGVIAMSRLFAKALAPRFTVNAILPGIHTTGIYLNSEDLIKQMMKMGNTTIPLGRIGTVEDVTNIFMFLASPASDYITGQYFVVSGGLAMY